ncbi:DUF2798 domain-containing protein [Lacrimispora algidixylanolytica]|uniref:DUF2798 domain-containing protein n=1 Tax=Lacrimispora algidixylanolytica TaxID=94868 RepID=A0A419SUM4_9FIRM|nr:DUF2798 domain-containing protein [Lacrimispora algidixylanolytica]RKD28904.1 DUF2798 domain-containing protein [Lacrimispora algidixylanolytica]
MPRNKFQTIIFTLLMTFFMVYVMICYNIALDMGNMKNQIFLLAFHEMIIMWPAAIIIELLIGERITMKLAKRIIAPVMENSIFIVLLISALTVCVMCPIMSLIAVILFKNPGTEIVAVWLNTVVFNFPMALMSQIFFVGPFVRLIFNNIFKSNFEKAVVK